MSLTEVAPVGQPLSPVPLLEEIEQRRVEMEAAAAVSGEQLYEPLLVMGLAERVGSNWFLDSVGNTMATHNEPFRQQLHATHPLSTVNPRLVQLDGNYVASSPYEQQWLVSFVASKYGPKPQATKETNLFFATEGYLKLFPDAPIAVLTRDPEGIASSFVGGNLYDRWDYDGRFAGLQQTAATPAFAEFGFVFEGADELTSLQKLTRMTVLNTILLARSLEGRRYEQVTYEQANFNQARILDAISSLVFGEPGRILLPAAADSAVATVDSTFSTKRSKTELLSELDDDDVLQIRGEVAEMLSRADQVLPGDVMARTRTLLDTGGATYRNIGRPTDTKRDRTVRSERPALPAQFIADEQLGIYWRNTLATNGEFAEFLTAMHSAGMPNVIDGTQLFFNENMMHTRGGRIHFNPATEQYEVSPGFEEHPAYWLTWIGATAFARYTGSRLPTRAEMQSLASRNDTDLSTINADYRVGDVVPALHTEDGIVDTVGNLAVWCADGPEANGRGAARFMYGTAWNKPATPTEIDKPKSRPMSGNSRGIGIRLVRDRAATEPASPTAIALAISRGIQALGQNRDSRSLAALDEAFAAELLV